MTIIVMIFINTDNVTVMYYMFYGCSSLTSLDLSHFNTSKVMFMDGMFGGCSGLTSLKVSNFNTGNVTIMRSMFSGCSGLKSLDLSSFNTGSVEDMSSMFMKCSALKAIYVGGGWTTDGVTEGWRLFEGCTSLVGGQGTAYNALYTDQTYARIDGGAAAPGYLTLMRDEEVGLGNTARIQRRIPAARIHDLSGRQLAAPKKGVNVVGGRKVIF